MSNPGTIQGPNLTLCNGCVPSIVVSPLYIGGNATYSPLNPNTSMEISDPSMNSSHKAWSKVSKYSFTSSMDFAILISFPPWPAPCFNTTGNSKVKSSGLFKI